MLDVGIRVQGKGGYRVEGEACAEVGAMWRSESWLPQLFLCLCGSTRPSQLAANSKPTNELSSCSLMYCPLARARATAQILKSKHEACTAIRGKEVLSLCSHSHYHVCNHVYSAPPT